jgi:hypothetical protein
MRQRGLVEVLQTLQTCNGTATMIGDHLDASSTFPVNNKSESARKLLRLQIAGGV